MNNNIYKQYITIDDDKDDQKYNCNFEGDVHFMMGPLSIYQFNQFANYGLCAVRLWQYIRTKQGLTYGHKKEYKGKDTSHLLSISIIKIFMIGLDYTNQLNGSI